MTTPHCFSCLGCEALKDGGSTGQPGSCMGCLNHQRLVHHSGQAKQPVPDKPEKPNETVKEQTA